MYKISFSKNALKLLSKFNKHTQKKIINYLEKETLLKNPTSLGKPLLYEKKGYWRYRVGDYRVITKIINDELIILVIDIDHRKEIYK